MEDISSYFYFALFTIVFLFVGGVMLYKWYFAQKYTRERFAFYSVWLFSGFLLSLIGLLLVRNQVLDLIVAFLNQGGAKITEYGQVDFFPTAGFILLCAGIFYFLIRNMHQNWNGVPSTRQVDLAETNRRVSLLEDFQFYRTNRDQIEVYRAREKSKPEVFSPYEPDNRPWHLKAANLFSLLDQQYHINVEKDWYREQECFISRYGQDEAKIGILCLDKRPSDERLRDFFDFVDKRGGNFEKLIVVIDGQGPESTGSKMGREIQTRFESELLDKLISLRHYQDFIKNYFEENVLENSELTMEDMYVPLGGHTVKIENGKLNKDEALESTEAYILNWAKDKKRLKSEQLAILGEYGQGKTVLMHKIVYEMLQDPEQYPRIPILIELRGLSPRTDNEFGIFGHWANRFKAKAEALWELHRAGKLLLILDGFDEMDLVGDTEMLFNHFSQLWALARVPNAQIIIAGRPNLFADDEQRRMALGIQEARTQLPYAKAIYLDKLRDEQIDQVLRHAKAETKTGILNALQQTAENSSFAEIISRPSTLFQLSTVWDAELAQKQERLNSATVIGSFINKTYDRQQSKGDHVLTSFERSYFMLGIATGMMLDNGYTNQVKHRDLQKMVEQLWANYPPKLPPYTDAMQGHRALDFLPERMKDNQNALETILKDVRAGGILVQDLSGRDVFKFAHKSYLEYLVSRFFSGFTLQNEHDRPLLMMVNAISKTFRFNDAKLKGSPDVEQFTAELIAAQIEKKDAQGNILPVNGNEKLYERELYKMLILKSYPWSGRLYPRAKIWLSLNTYLPLFLWIGILAVLCLAGYFIFIDKPWKDVFLDVYRWLFLIWVVILAVYMKKLSVDSPRANYISKFRLYVLSCQQVNCPEKKLTLTLKFIIHEMGHSTVLQKLSMIILTYFISFAGAGLFAGLLAKSLIIKSTDLIQGSGMLTFTFAFTSAFTVVFIFGIIFITVSGGIVSRRAGLMRGLIASVTAGVTAGVIASVIAGAGVGIEAGAGTGAFGGMLFLISSIKKPYRKALKKIKAAAKHKL